MRGDYQKGNLYKQMALETKNAIKAAYINGYNVDNNRQGALAEVLYFKIVEGEQAKSIAKRLYETVKNSGFFLETGILGLKALLNALSAYGYTEAAYKVVSHYDYPSYGYWKNCGATTLWENWNGVGSQNHHMYADVLNWTYRNVLGLKNSSIAYKQCIVEPFFYSENCNAEGKTETPYGAISLKWERNGNDVLLELAAPNEIEILLKMPNKKPTPIMSGKFKFTL